MIRKSEIDANKMELGFEHLLDNQRESMKTSRLVTISLMVAAGVLLGMKITIGWLFLVMALMLLAGLIYRYTGFRRELAKVGDEEGFKRQLANSKYYEGFGLYLTEDYAILERPSFAVYPLAAMDKFEVGIAGEMSKALFLTDPKGQRHKIAETSKGDAMQKDFDELYHIVRNYFKSRNSETKSE